MLRALRSEKYVVNPELITETGQFAVSKDTTFFGLRFADTKLEDEFVVHQWTSRTKIVFCGIFCPICVIVFPYLNNEDGTWSQYWYLSNAIIWLVFGVLDYVLHGYLRIGTMRARCLRTEKLAAFLLMVAMLTFQMTHYHWVNRCLIDPAIPAEKKMNECVYRQSAMTIASVSYLWVMVPRTILMAPLMLQALVAFTASRYVVAFHAYANGFNEYFSKLVVLLVYCAGFALLVAAVERINRKALLLLLDIHRNKVMYQRERDAIFRVLNAMLPPAALKRVLRRIVHTKDHARGSVVQLDIANFTKWCETRASLVVVEMISEVVTNFDAKAAELGVQKVKTIGDAYLAVVGLLPNNIWPQNKRIHNKNRGGGRHMNRLEDHKCYLYSTAAIGFLFANSMHSTVAEHFEKRQKKGKTADASQGADHVIDIRDVEDLDESVKSRSVSSAVDENGNRKAEEPAVATRAEIALEEEPGNGEAPVPHHAKGSRRGSTASSTCLASTLQALARTNTSVASCQNASQGGGGGDVLQARVGIATGEVTGAIIGSAPYTYDIFGPVCTLANLLEQESLSGHTLVCAETHAELTYYWRAVSELAQPTSISGDGDIVVYEDEDEDTEGGANRNEISDNTLELNTPTENEFPQFTSVSQMNTSKSEAAVQKTGFLYNAISDTPENIELLQPPSLPPSRERLSLIAASSGNSSNFENSCRSYVESLSGGSRSVSHSRGSPSVCASPFAADGEDQFALIIENMDILLGTDPRSGLGVGAATDTTSNLESVEVMSTATGGPLTGGMGARPGPAGPLTTATITLNPKALRHERDHNNASETGSEHTAPPSPHQELDAGEGMHDRNHSNTDDENPAEYLDDIVDMVGQSEEDFDTREPKFLAFALQHDLHQSYAPTLQVLFNLFCFFVACLLGNSIEDRLMTHWVLTVGIVVVCCITLPMIWYGMHRKLFNPVMNMVFLYAVFCIFHFSAGMNQGTTVSNSSVFPAPIFLFSNLYLTRGTDLIYRQMFQTLLMISQVALDIIFYTPFSTGRLFFLVLLNWLFFTANTYAYDNCITSAKHYLIAHHSLKSAHKEKTLFERVLKTIMPQHVVGELLHRFEKNSVAPIVSDLPLAGIAFMTVHSNFAAATPTSPTAAGGGGPQLPEASPPPQVASLPATPNNGSSSLQVSTAQQIESVQHILVCIEKCISHFPLLLKVKTVGNTLLVGSCLRHTDQDRAVEGLQQLLALSIVLKRELNGEPSGLLSPAQKLQQQATATPAKDGKVEAMSTEHDAISERSTSVSKSGGGGGSSGKSNNKTSKSRNKKFHSIVNKPSVLHSAGSPLGHAPSTTTTTTTVSVENAIAPAVGTAPPRPKYALLVGAHCGTATAAVLGTQQLVFDVYGTTVNYASRVLTRSMTVFGKHESRIHASKDFVEHIHMPQMKAVTSMSSLLSAPSTGKDQPLVVANNNNNQEEGTAGLKQFQNPLFPTHNQRHSSIGSEGPTPSSTLEQSTGSSSKVTIPLGPAGAAVIEDEAMRALFAQMGAMKWSKATALTAGGFSSGITVKTTKLK